MVGFVFDQGDISGIERNEYKLTKKEERERERKKEELFLQKMRV